MREKKSNSGYTLIELLAVLIVLSIIIVIVIPVFYKVIANVKKSAIKSSANGLMKSADLYYINNMDNMEDAVEFKINNGVQVSDYKLKYSGKVKMGYLMLFKDNKIAICIDDGEYAAAKGVNDKDLTVYSGTCTGEYDSETMSYLVSQRTGGFMALSIRSYSSKNDLPTSARSNDLGIITDTKITGYYISGIVPDSPEEGLVWIVESPKSPFYLESDNIRLGITYVMQYEAGKWNIKQAYAYNNEWKLLYYVDIASGNINLENSNLGDINIVNNFDYTGEYQEFTAPFSGYYNVELWGAQGGTNYSTAPGGLGSYTSGDIYLDTGSKIYIYVGGTNSNPSGGWNGGGDGASLGQGSAGGGGGATDIRITPSSSKTAWGEFDSLKSRIMVAAGGGGGSYYASSYYGSGGAGGGLLGYASNIVAGDASPGSGANTTYGGRSKYDSNAAKTTLGGFGYGGKSYITWSAAGGGGGYYGGGGGSYAGAGGGGGSSYISGHEGCNSINDNSTSGNIIFSGKQIHYSDIFFINTLMVDGQGYNWSSTKQMLTRMPSYDGSTTIVGNTGSGHAKITLRTVEQVDQSSRNNLREENEKVWNYTYSGNYQILEIEKNGIYNVQLWGAKGGANNSNAPGGLGSYTSGNIYLKEGTTIYFYIGGTPVFTESGWNGGGEGATNSQGSAGGGGGSTDVRIMDGSWGEFDSLKSRIMVAAGGGGGSYYTMDYYGKGGAGGGVSGYTGSIVVGGASPGTGGKSNYAGTSYYDNNALTTTVGGFGFGGKAYPSWSAAGGGGGFYGGGGGSFAGASGGGGASYISGHGGCNSILETSTSNNIIHSGSAYHYNGYYFTSTNMVDGQGYNWSSYIQARTYMPNINYSGTMTGNAENGYGKVTLIEEKTIDDATINSNYIANDNLWAYDANSRMQYFNATKDGTYKIELWGAQGATNYPSTPGGLGAYTSGEIYLTKGTKLYVGVGTMQVTLNSTLGGWNGGGNGASIVSGSAGGGGGATDIRISNTSLLNLWNEASSLRSRIMVAGGGGGGSFYGSSYYGTGGSGGGLIGYTGYNVVGGGSPGIGGNQVLGGFSSYDASAKNVTMGEYGIGGKSYTSWSAAGGGGGHYGGGGGSFAGASGGGGSSFISGHPGCIAITSGGIPKVETYSNLSDSVSYTGYKFVNTTMIDGSGYPWTTTKSVSSSGMPSPSSANTQTGNSGNGYAKITYLGD